MLSRRVLVQRGWTPALILAILRTPDQVVHHARGYRRWSEHLYDDDRVAGGEKDPRFLEAAARRRARAQAARRRQAEIPEKFENWQAALGEAAGYLFSLNRYAKHRSCSELQRVEIYTLKNEFIRTLHDKGYCTASWIHRLTLPEQKCRECGGDGDECGHCGGTGVWREARIVEFWCFRFLVAGRTYCWHQPRASVDFAPAEGLPPQDWEGLGGEKPVALPRRKFAYAKELLRWVIDAANGEEPPAQEAQAPAAVMRTEPPGGPQLPLFAA